MNIESKRLSHIWTAYFFMMLLILAGSAVISFLFIKSMPFLGDSPVRLLQLAQYIPIYLILMPLGMLALRGVRDVEKPKQRKLGLGKWILFVLISYGVMMPASLLGTGLMYLVGLIQGQPIMNPTVDILYNYDIGLNLLIVSIIAPVMEELVFRKLLIDRLRRYGELAAVLASAVVFGLYHGNFFQFFYAFVFGVTQGYLYVKTGRLRYTIAIHITVNFISSVVMPLLMRQVMAGLSLSTMLPMLLLLMLELAIFGITIAGIVLAIVYRKQFRFRRGPLCVPAKRWLRTAFVNPGAVLLLLIMIAGFVLRWR